MIHGPAAREDEDAKARLRAALGMALGMAGVVAGGAGCRVTFHGMRQCAGPGSALRRGNGRGRRRRRARWLPRLRRLRNWSRCAGGSELGSGCRLRRFRILPSLPPLDIREGTLRRCLCRSVPPWHRAPPRKNHANLGGAGGEFLNLQRSERVAESGSPPRECKSRGGLLETRKKNLIPKGSISRHLAQSRPISPNLRGVGTGTGPWKRITGPNSSATVFWPREE